MGLVLYQDPFPSENLYINETILSQDISTFVILKTRWYSIHLVSLDPYGELRDRHLTEPLPTKSFLRHLEVLNRI